MTLTPMTNLTKILQFLAVIKNKLWERKIAKSIVYVYTDTIILTIFLKNMINQFEDCFRSFELSHEKYSVNLNRNKTEWLRS